MKKFVRGIRKFIQLLRSFGRALHNPRTCILFVIVIALSCVSVFLYVTRPTQLDKLGISYLELLDRSVVQENVSEKFKNTYEANDYLIYGENMMFYANEYDGNVDPMQGMNVLLRNVETEEEISYTFSGGVDSGIGLASLSQGLYEVYVYDNYVKKRLYFQDEEESLNFSTMRRNEMVKNVQVHASKDYLKDFGVNMDKNYVFISVVDNIPMVRTIDVLIDPGGNVYNEADNSIDYGVGNDLINEASASLELAEMLKEKLEAKGLRVELTRDAESTPSYYGKSGRAGIGYEKQAKVFISLGMFVDETQTRPIMMISPYTSGLLANEVSYTLLQNGIELPDISAQENLNLGILYDSFRVDEEGNSTKFELYPQLRETGGKATFAGQAENSKSNQAYADYYGMNSIYFQFANLASTDSINYYLENKETIATSIADAITNYYEIEGETDETTTE